MPTPVPMQIPPPQLSPALAKIPGPKEDVLNRLLQHRDGLGGYVDTLWDLRQQYGDVFRLTLAGQNFIAVFSPSAAEKVFRNESKYPSTVAFEVWKKMDQQDQVPSLKHSFFLREGAEWKRLRTEVQRRILPPLEAQKFIAPLAPVMVNASKLIEARLTKGATNPLKLTSFLTSVTIESISTMIFGEGIGALDLKEPPKRTVDFVNCTLATQELSLALEMGADQSWRAPGPVSPENTLYHSLIHNFDLTWKIGVEFLNEAKNKLLKTTDEASLPLLPYLMQRGNLTEEELNGNIFTVFAAGVDTTSVILQWLLYWLAKNPTIQDKIAREIHDALQGKDLTDPQTLRSLPLMKNALKETHRISPAAFGTMRTLEEDIELNGHVVPKNTRIILAVNILGKDPKIYPNPEQFNPDRWEGKEEEPFTLLPFGFGPRMCIGFRLATNEIYVFLARLLQDWQLTLADPSVEVRGVNVLLTRPTPAPEIVFERRKF